MTDWDLWITSSINQYFSDNLTTYPIYLEGFTKNPEDNENQFEIRINGPSYINVLSKFVEVNVQVDILIKSQSTARDRYVGNKMKGIAVSVSDNSIPIYKFPEFPDVLVDCLHPQKDIDIRNFGPVDSPGSVNYSTVVTDYKTILRKP